MCINCIFNLCNFEVLFFGKKRNFKKEEEMKIKLQRPIVGKITSKFGNRIHPVTKLKSFHNGIDFAGKIGDSIFSPDSGKVSEVYYTKNGGHTLIIELDCGLQSRMCHLNKILVKPMQVVERGEVIAECGNTGVGTGPHLHFGIKKNGEYADPEIYL